MCFLKTIYMPPRDQNKLPIEDIHTKTQGCKLSFRIRCNFLLIITHNNSRQTQPNNYKMPSFNYLLLYSGTHYKCFCNCAYAKGASFSPIISSATAAAAKSLQSCPTLCDPIDSSPPCSSVHGILQARTLEWVAISSSNARTLEWVAISSSKVKLPSRVRLLATPWTAAHQAPPSM